MVLAHSTASPIISETQTVSLTMKIAGYSQTKGIGVGNSIKSSKFAVGGHSWYISYFPEGYQQETSDWVAAFLHLEKPPAPHDNVIVTAAFQFSLLDGNCQYCQVFGSSGEAGRTFSFGNPWGFNQFFKRKKLGSLWWCFWHLGGQAFHIRCDVTVLGTHRPPADTPMAVSAPPLPPAVLPPASDLHRHLGEILATGDGADVCFMVAGEPVLAHRSVVSARSSVLKDVLLGPGKETAGTSIEIDNMDPSVFRAMLHFIYTDALPHIEEGNRAPMAQWLLEAAHTFNIERLKLISEDILCNDINGETVVSTLMLAEEYGCQRLKKACLMFIKATPLPLLERGRPE